MTNAPHTASSKTYTDEDIKNLVDTKTGKYSPEIYTSEELYQLELEKIFARTWICVGHESQLPNYGDFQSAYIGEDPVVVVRQKDNSIRVFLNQCRHRGMRICRVDAGNARAFTCPYHGWAYDSAGNLVSVPMETAAFNDALKKDEWGPKQARVETYKGLIFANWDESAPDLDTYLGDAKFYMDTMLDRVEGGTEVIEGIQKWVIPANWKFAAEQFGSDAYHAGTTSHISGIMAGAPAGTDLTKMQPPTDGLNVYIGNGHACGLFLRNPMFYQVIVGPAVTEYLTQTSYPEAVERVGKERADINLCHMNVFPNLSFLTGINTVRMWQPRGPHEMEIWSFTIVDKKAPDAIKQEWARHNVRTFSAGGVFEQDDGENWNDIQHVLRGHVAKQQKFNIQMSDHTVRDAEPGYPGKSFANTYGEEAARNIYAHWARMLTTSDWSALDSVATLKAAE
ncbi:benzene 1,2-dioxygenase [Salipiger aestuarii]|uniref:Biphenyl 2,3-dioxygenase alpha subunit n=1 Tax=Salipiger aestuarii TaxID=568098 RepID=A0A327YFB7_9RHOB|nr:aromatic ring-hydroxylating dioxygenase subunit alpha [Salipiger aestuarii]EIE49957.1 IPB-dioxygenase, ISP large subunit (IpbA1) [Citreicella sp. 357]KAA8605746.1 benzene 1,2-dioxygenase [Salipiger aestuarii]KAA8612171.1 benzene 1,2-dioxygenase [Salipiger aestuarii]KAB2539905.1 benzene 1,2-dioxygenase [Salipiger aestuarii]RAK18515.1 biphenyl 2,3-dioxygenase alpha subunit [Salipiger aestuarii]